MEEKVTIFGKVADYCGQRVWRGIFAVVVFSLMTGGGPVRAVEVSQVLTRQLWPWSSDVMVTYSLSGEGTGEYDVAFTVTKDGETNAVPFGANDWFGRHGVKSGETRSFRWDPSKTALSNAVSANVRVALELKPVEYIVIDVSGGTSATEFPVTTLDRVPEGGWGDEYKTDKIVLRRVRAGTFMMGSPEDEFGRNDEWEFLHEVTLTEDFYIGVFEITCGQFSRVTGRDSSAYYTTGANYDDRKPAEKISYNQIRGETLGAKWPKNSGVDSTSFLGILREKTKNATLPDGCCFDLPTEAQWEYACRGGTTAALHSGRNLTHTNGVDEALSELCLYKGTAGYGSTSIVGTYKPNSLGLYDMLGNVQEICLDWAKKDLGNSPVTDPLGPSSGYNRIRRSGSRWSDAYCCRSAYRNYVGATDVGYVWGFRLACRRYITEE